MTAGPSILLLSVLAWSLLGCIANRPTLTCPRKGGPPWRELTTPHFIIRTDLQGDDAGAIARDLETSRAALGAVLGVPDGAAMRLQVIVFERERDFSALTGYPGAGGYYVSMVPGDVEHRPAVVFFGGLDYPTRRTLQHELVHQILHSRTSHIPWWLSEGLAETYSTLRLDGDVAFVGEPPRDVDFWEGEYTVTEAITRVHKVLFPAFRAPPLSALVRADRLSVDASGDQPIYYAAAWKLVHLLRGHTDPRRAPRFKAMLGFLVNGTPGEQAFTEAYEQMSLEDLSEEYQKFLLDNRERPEGVKVSLPPVAPPAVRLLSDADVHALWATLIMPGRSTATTPDEEIARGLAEDPGDPALLYARASNRMVRGDWREAHSEAWELLRLDGADARYLYLDLCGAYTALTEEKEPAAREVRLKRIAGIVDRLLPVAETSWQRVLTALSLMELKRHDEAETLADRAAKADPSCGECFAVSALLLARKGREAAAREALTRAEALIPRGSRMMNVPRLRRDVEKALKEHAPR